MTWGLLDVVTRDAEAAIDDARESGLIDFQTACFQVLRMEESPEKAHMLARLGGLALLSADWCRREHEERREKTK